MRRRLAAVLLISLASSSRADDGGARVTFGGKPAASRIGLVPAGPGGVLWDSGPSDPLAADYKAILIQGVLPDPGLVFEARLRGGAGWGPAARAGVTRFENGRFWAKFPLSGRKGDVVRLILREGGLSSYEDVRLSGIELVSREREGRVLAASAPVEPPIPAPAEKPTVLSRESWGAAPAATPYEPMIPARITIHHTETVQPAAPKEAAEELRVIQNFHQHGRGWIDIGYHFLIDGSGRIWQGRPEMVVGAHVQDRNEGNVGIALMGDFQGPEGEKPTPKQIRSLISLVRWLAAAYGIPPSEIRGHRDQQSTTCPGDRLYARLGRIRREAAAAPPAVATRLRGTGVPAAARIPAELHGSGILFDGRGSR